MTTDRIPSGLAPSGSSLLFTHDTIPEALRQEHSLSPGHWGVLHVFDGHLRFINLQDGSEAAVDAPDLMTIHPEVPHRVEVDGPLRCRIDFFRELDEGVTMRTPGAFADASVRRSFERCEESGNFAGTFYDEFLGSSPVVAAYFGSTDFSTQRKALRESVHMLVTRDVSDPEMREVIDRLGRAHSRDGRDILPGLYELWLDSICQTVRILDPEWSEQLEREWRVRLRAGMQLIMAAY